ncbi:type IV pilus biogenesis/stability protein PilW [Avibacterium avium]|uniref:type IV pilus biogenesis/stability protein PilW n=1 Tax=Avibacterium avium TaxID=751 RepID=UPI003BF8BEB4
MKMRQGYLVMLFSLLLCACVSPQTSKEDFDKQQAAKARVELGIGYLEQRELSLSLAKQNLDKALAYAPNYYLVHSALAYFYQLQGDNERAENAYLTALKLDDKQGNVFNNYAVFLCKQGRFTQAYQQFQQALNSPNYYQQTDTYENLALCALAEKNTALYQQYRELLEKADPKRANSLPKQI